MFCMKCGTEIPEGAAFCPKCGAKVGEMSAVQEEVKQEPKEPEPSTITLLHGKPVDVAVLHDKYKLYKEGYKMIPAAVYVQNQTKCTTNESLFFMKTLENNEAFRDYFVKKDAAEAAELEAWKKSGVLYCPKCHSRNISIDKKGYSLTKGVVGAVALGPIGLIAGAHHANRRRYKCLDCGQEWHD
ncbi:MAG: zinc ribbon domain-containing protein [Acidaminococcaceae bacterium]|nr:zinc ribbon domain-containing protein [Acidaminococcaceae bacterium]